MVYSEQKDLIKEKENICKAIEYNTGNPTYHYYLGVLYFNEKDFENAIMEFRLCTNIISDVSEYYFQLGDSYYMNKHYSEAADACSRAVELDTTST